MELHKMMGGLLREVTCFQKEAQIIDQTPLKLILLYGIKLHKPSTNMYWYTYSILGLLWFRHIPQTIMWYR